MIDFAFKPVVVIGAARSGTNMLRDILTSLPGIDTWPCDEIPFIWRHGNRGHAHDEFTPRMARNDVVDFVRKSFRNTANPSTELLVEKTCANSLRVEFIDRILPDARYVYVVRDGRDAAASAMLRWRSGFDLRYSLAKARYVPLGDLPYYGSRFLLNRLNRLTSGDRRLATWGPIFEGLRDLPHDTPLHVLAARQWARCVDRSDAAFAAMDDKRVVRVRYEDFVRDPAPGLADIAAGLDIRISDQAVRNAVEGVRGNSIGKGARSLPADVLADVEDIASATLARHGYTPTSEAPTR